MTAYNDTHDDDRDVSPPPRDELDALLRTWHDENAAAARLGRDRLLASISAESNGRPIGKPHAATSSSSFGRLDVSTFGLLSDADGSAGASPAPRVEGQAERFIRRFLMNRYSAVAAAILLVVFTGVLWTDDSRRSQARADLVQVPDGGRLDAVDSRGNLIGPCPLKHTDVNVDVSGRFARVTLVQRYENPYHDKIEAVYTFPLSHRAAVDQMTMTIGPRVVVGEVKERNQARAIYQAAKQAGHVAGLLEQERPNIFTQSVANIEPGVEVLIEISYVELLEDKAGEFSFEFPMVVASRYIPGDMVGAPIALPAGIVPRRGVILLGPAQINVTQAVSTTELGELDSHRLADILSAAMPIEMPDASAWTQTNADGQPVQPQVWHQFEAVYANGGKDFGFLYTNGLGVLDNRWFRFDASATQPSGAGFAPNTTQVPDASRITPMPVKPPTRAGHDISMTVNIDTGGPGLLDLTSKLHEISTQYNALRPDATPSSATLRLLTHTDIPNRDFVLTWRQTADTITEQVFTHAGPKGNFLTVIINPPKRVAVEDAVPRELVFVLDTSGSMSGQPIDKAKAVMSRAIAALRPQDTFNLITFSGDTHVLWQTPQPATPDKLAEAQQFLASREGSGGTEMMTAINAALEQTPLLATSVAPQRPDLSGRQGETYDAIYGEIRRQMEMAIVSRKDLLSGGTDPADVAVRTLEQKIAKAKQLLEERGEIVDIDGFQASNQPDISIRELAALPADGRSVVVYHAFPAPADEITHGPQAFDFPVGDGRTIRTEVLAWGFRSGLIHPTIGLPVRFTGRWVTRDNAPVFEVAQANWTDSKPPTPLRVVCFMTDGQVGNDMAIIDAVRKNAATTRVFAFGIGNSVNRYLLDNVASAGRGEVEYVLLNDDADAAVQRFVQRIQTPVLTSITLETTGDLELVGRVPDPIPDLWDERPIILHALYTVAPVAADPSEPTTVVVEGSLSDPSRDADQSRAVLSPVSDEQQSPLTDVRGSVRRGTLTIRGNAGAGPWSKSIDIDLPEIQPDNDVIATLWARAEVERIMNTDLAAAQAGNFPPDKRARVVSLGEDFSIMTQFTSFVAVENLRVTVAGEPRLVPVPIELPDGQEWEGTMGREIGEWADELVGVPLQQIGVDQRAGPPIGFVSMVQEQNIQARLHDTIPELNFEAAPFEQVVKKLSEVTGTQIEVDWAAMETAAIEPDAEVNLRLSNVSAEKAIQLITDAVGAGETELGYTTTDAGIRISLKEALEQRTRVVVYDVNDLVFAVPDFKGRRIERGEAGRIESGLDRGKEGLISSEAELEKELLWQMAVQTHKDAAAKANKAVNFEDFAEARKQLEIAKTIIEVNRHHQSNASTVAGLQDQTRALQRYVDDEERAFNERSTKQVSDEVAGREAERIETIARTTREQTENLMAQVEELRKESRYEEATQVLKQVLVMDPQNERAATMKKTLEDVSLHTRGRRANASTQREFQDGMIDTEEALVPWHQDAKVEAEAEPTGGTMAAGRFVPSGQTSSVITPEQLGFSVSGARFHGFHGEPFAAIRGSQLHYPAESAPATNTATGGESEMAYSFLGGYAGPASAPNPNTAAPSSGEQFGWSKQTGDRNLDGVPDTGDGQVLRIQDAKKLWYGDGTPYFDTNGDGVPDAPAPTLRVPAANVPQTETATRGRVNVNTVESGGLGGFGGGQSDAGDSIFTYSLGTNFTPAQQPAPIPIAPPGPGPQPYGQPGLVPPQQPAPDVASSPTKIREGSGGGNPPSGELSVISSVGIGFTAAPAQQPALDAAGKPIAPVAGQSPSAGEPVARSNALNYASPDEAAKLLRQVFPEGREPITAGGTNNLADHYGLFTNSAAVPSDARVRGAWWQDDASIAPGTSKDANFDSDEVARRLSEMSSGNSRTRRMMKLDGLTPEKAQELIRQLQDQQKPATQPAGGRNVTQLDMARPGSVDELRREVENLEWRGQQSHNTNREGRDTFFKDTAQDDTYFGRATGPTEFFEIRDAGSRYETVLGDIPALGDFSFPRNWPEISAKRAGAVETTELEADKVVRRKLQTTAPEIRFDAQPFEMVIEYLRELTGLNLSVNWTAIEACGVKKDAEVHFTTSNIKFAQLLDQVLAHAAQGTSCELGYTANQGVVEISTKAALATAAPAPANKPAARPVYIEQLLLRIAGMALNGRLEAAAGYGTDLARRLPNYAPAALLADTLTNGVISHESRFARVEQIARAATAVLADRAARIKRAARKIDEPLLAWALKSEISDLKSASVTPPNATASTAPIPHSALRTPHSLDLLDGRALVTILLADSSDAAMTALKAAGLTVESAPPGTKLVVGRLDRTALFAAASLDPVKRITATPAAKKVVRR